MILSREGITTRAKRESASVEAIPDSSERGRESARSNQKQS